MDQARPTRKLLDWKPVGIRPVGRPRQRWQEDVMEDLKKLKIKTGRKQLRAELGERWLRRGKPQRVVVPNYYYYYYLSHTKRDCTPARYIFNSNISSTGPKRRRSSLSSAKYFQGHPQTPHSLSVVA